MTWASRGKLLLGIVMVFAIVGASTVVFNQRQQQSVSLSAAIAAEQHPVGAEYGGTVVAQHVVAGDEVEAGDTLFEVQSLQLERDLAIGNVQPRFGAISSDGILIVVAPVSGVVSDIDVVEGGFAQAGTVIANIDRQGSLFVEAEFLLSPRDFGRIENDAFVELLLPDQRTLSGVVETVTVSTVGGDALATMRINSDQLIFGEANGLVRPGTPVEATLHLRDDGIFVGVEDVFTDLMRKIGL